MAVNLNAIGFDHFLGLYFSFVVPTRVYLSENQDVSSETLVIRQGIFFKYSNSLSLRDY